MTDSFFFFVDFKHYQTSKSKNYSNNILLILKQPYKNEAALYVHLKNVYLTHFQQCQSQHETSKEA